MVTPDDITADDRPTDDVTAGVSTSDETTRGAAAPDHASPPDGAPPLTRAGAAWVATGVALLLLVLLIVFVLQNPTRVDVTFLGLTGNLPLGMALLIASVGGGLLVAIAGVARIAQLRLNARRVRRGRDHD